MTARALLGALVGLLLAALSWIGNELGAREGAVSAFPDLTTLFAAPVLIFLTVRLVALPDRDLVRRAALAVVLAAALVFGGSQVVLGALRFMNPSGPLLAAGFVMGFLAVALTGAVGAWAALRWPRGGRATNDSQGGGG